MRWSLFGTFLMAVFPAMPSWCQTVDYSKIFFGNEASGWAPQQLGAFNHEIQQFMDLQLSNIYRGCPDASLPSLDPATKALFENLSLTQESSRDATPGRSGSVANTPLEYRSFDFDWGIDDATTEMTSVRIRELQDDKTWGSWKAVPVGTDIETLLEADGRPMGGYEIDANSLTRRDTLAPSLFVAKSPEALAGYIKLVGSPTLAGVPVILDFDESAGNALLSAYRTVSGNGLFSESTSIPPDFLKNVFGPFGGVDDVRCPKRAPQPSGVNAGSTVPGDVAPSATMVGPLEKDKLKAGVHDSVPPTAVEEREPEPPSEVDTAGSGTVADFVCRAEVSAEQCIDLVKRVVEGVWAVVVVNESEVKIQEGTLTFGPLRTALDRIRVALAMDDPLCDVQGGGFHAKMLNYFASRPGLALCGGVMIRDPAGGSAPMFLTAAHCLKDELFDSRRVFLVGDYYLESPGLVMANLTFRSAEWVEVDQKRVQSFRKDGTGPDLAIVRLQPDDVDPEKLNVMARDVKLAVDQQVLSRGFPAGIPRVSLDPSESLVRRIDQTAFYAQIDNLGRSSGSPIFDSFGAVIGILSKEVANMILSKDGRTGCAAFDSLSDVPDQMVQSMLPRVEFADQVCGQISCQP